MPTLLTAAVLGHHASSTSTSAAAAAGGRARRWCGGVVARLERLCVPLAQRQRPIGDVSSRRLRGSGGVLLRDDDDDARAAANAALTRDDWAVGDDRLPTVAEALGDYNWGL